MSEIFSDIVGAPLHLPLILALSVLYVIVSAIRTYDARLIQAKQKGFYSGVAAKAEGRSLPQWVNIFHWAGWVIFVVFLLLNWKYALALYALLFALRTLPILENLGLLMMHPFLQ
ncbi:MAG: hypothetical protein JRI48_00880 [Deltaproteobacteria bacterium]|nr:hypothetical protein [Deltaproteobacteria bacterium]